MNQTEYFVRRDADLPKPKFAYGDRVFAQWNNIPVVGMVIREVATKSVLIHSDLPVQFEDRAHYILKIPTKEIRRTHVEK